MEGATAVWGNKWKVSNCSEKISPGERGVCVWVGREQGEWFLVNMGYASKVCDVIMAAWSVYGRVGEGCKCDGLGARNGSAVCWSRAGGAWEIYQWLFADDTALVAHSRGWWQSLGVYVDIECWKSIVNRSKVITCSGGGGRVRAVRMTVKMGRSSRKWSA